jgi:type IV secretory pathway VirB10-like protein
LITNRDDYLKHSSKNYTAEQKQYNNWLTQQLLEVAERHRYVFDPEEFNFVAIRDRIRCYYKSYVQTARKRGMQLPASERSSKKAKTDNGEDDAHDDEDNKSVGGNDKEDTKGREENKHDSTREGSREGENASSQDKGKEEREPAPQ